MSNFAVSHSNTWCARLHPPTMLVSSSVTRCAIMNHMCGPHLRSPRVTFVVRGSSREPYQRHCRHPDCRLNEIKKGPVVCLRRLRSLTVLPLFPCAAIGPTPLRGSPNWSTGMSELCVCVCVCVCPASYAVFRNFFMGRQGLGVCVQK